MKLFGWDIQSYFDVWFYNYLFGYELCRDQYWLSRLICRFRNHPKGPIFYNSCGLEPNNHCIDCGDEIC